MKLRYWPLIGLTALHLAGCTGASHSILLRTAMSPKFADNFGTLVQAYNKGHADAVIDWKNVPPGTAATAEKTGWEIVAAGDGRLREDRQPFLDQVSPKLLMSLVPAFQDWRRSDPRGAFLPLVATQPVMIVDSDSIDKGLGAVPTSLGDLFKRAAEHRRKVGRAIWAPPFGDPDMVMRFVHAQGATVVDIKGEPTYPAGELPALLSPWVAAFKNGDIAKECLNWDEKEAARQVIAGVADIAVGGADALQVFEARPNKQVRKFHLFRPVTGIVEDQWVEPIGLVHCDQAGASLGEQNMIAFLLSRPAQIALANGYQAVPLVKEALKPFGTEAKAVTPTMETYVTTMCIFANDGLPLAPLNPKRDHIAAGIRLALLKAVEGMPVADAVAAGQAVADGRGG